MRELSELGHFPADAIQGDTVSFIAWYRDGRLLTINRQFESLTGYTKEEIDRMKWPDDFTPPEVGNTIRRSMSVLDRGEKSHEHDGELIRKDGTKVAVMLFVHKFFPDDGSEPFYFSFITDITDRNKKKDELQEAKAQAELFLDLLSHDISNMNQIAIGYLEMALNTIDLKPGEKELIATSLGSLMNSARIIDNVKRVQREKARLGQQRILDMDSIVRGAIDNFRESPGRDIKISYKPCKCMVLGNELLNDVFINLIGNAIKHSSGPLTIGIRLEMIKTDNMHFCQVSVEDNGPGIPEDMKKKLAADSCLMKTRLTGKGFGLCLTRMIVEDLGGKLLIEDRVPGDYTQGVRFIVQLPAAPGSAGMIEEQASA